MEGIAVAITGYCLPVLHTPPASEWDSPLRGPSLQEFGFLLGVGRGRERKSEGCDPE